VLCYSCHREVPKGKHIHGPAAVWNCLACHNPEPYPSKYGFSTVDPWKIVKSTRPVEPMVFTFSTIGLFRPGSRLLISKEKAREAFADVIEYMKQNPGDKLRLEVHTDNLPPKRIKTRKGKWIGYKSNLSLSRARSRTLAGLLKESGIIAKRTIAVGMGDKLPKATNKAPEGREINNRVEVVVYPPYARVVNSRKLPVLRDRVRVIISAVYRQGPPIKRLRFVEQVPKGMQYVKGSGFFRGRQVEPKISGGNLRWELGDMESSFSEDIFYVLKKRKRSGEVPEGTKILYRARDHDFSREFDPSEPSPPRLTVMETCLKCHQDIARKKIKHGPAGAGYCNLCHDPHASRNPAWLRKPIWSLCTTCHADKGSGVHVVAGFVSGNSHPTRKRRDPARPGKRLSCTSCHEPHGGETQDLFAYEVKNRTELCSLCHRK
jgi:predicted CXXCH cytochrome family protein